MAARGIGLLVCGTDGFFHLEMQSRLFFGVRIFHLGDLGGEVVARLFQTLFFVRQRRIYFGKTLVCQRLGGQRLLCLLSLFCFVLQQGFLCLKLLFLFLQRLLLLFHCLLKSQACVFRSVVSPFFCIKLFVQKVDAALQTLDFHV